MKKENYEAAEMELITFETEDVITASIPELPGQDPNQDPNMY